MKRQGKFCITSCLAIKGEFCITLCLAIMLTKSSGYYVTGSYGQLGLAFFISGIDESGCLSNACTIAPECINEQNGCQACLVTLANSSSIGRSCCPNDTLAVNNPCNQKSQCCTKECYKNEYNVIPICCIPNGGIINGVFACTTQACCSGFSNGTHCTCRSPGNTCVIGGFPNQCCNGHCISSFC